ncbi:MAG TPA: hypothetical protein VN253_01035 [Kofleriaceae bacterium]|nr:hypothetical protein [Kofleriaceae bacterium]
MSESRQQIERLVEALDEEPVDDEEAKEAVAALGVDVKGLAASIRARVAAADAASREARFHGEPDAQIHLGRASVAWFPTVLTRIRRRAPGIRRGDRALRASTDRACRRQRASVVI